MSLYNIISEKIILPVSDKKTKWDIYKSMKFLEASQWWSFEQLIEYQNQKLKELIGYVYSNVPYYNKVMKEHGLIPNDIQTVEDLKKIPILTKKDVQNNFPNAICSKTIKSGSYRNGKSSGSTGVPIRYYISNYAYGFNKAAYLRGWSWMEFNLGDKLIKISQNKRKSHLKKMQDFFDRTYLFNQSYTDENFEFFVQKMKTYKPMFLRSYPDPLEFLARYIVKNNVKIPAVKAINTTGNMLFDETRQLIEEAFNTRIFDSYSCEGGANTFECPSHTCYHTSMEYAISEIIDDNGMEVDYNQSGLHLTTDLLNYATPLIRYDSGDQVTKGPKNCSCGRGLMTVSKIKGRNNDIVITPDGNHLIAQSFTTYFKHIPEIKQFQVKQDKFNHIIFIFIVDSTFNSTIGKKIIDDWTKRLNFSTKIDIMLEENIPLLQSGKRRFIFRDKSIKL